MGKNSVLLGVILTIVVIVIGLVGWLYGDKIKSDINDKLSNNTETVEQSQSTANGNITLNIKI